MANVDYCSLSRCVQIFFAVGCGNPAPFTGDSKGISFLEIARKERWMIRHGVRILAEHRNRTLIDSSAIIPAATLLLGAMFMRALAESGFGTLLPDGGETGRERGIFLVQGVIQIAASMLHDLVQPAD